MVGNAAAAFAALIVDPMLARSEAAIVNASGTAITNDICDLLDRTTRMVAADHRALGRNKSYPASQTAEAIWPPARTLRYDRQSPWLATGFDRRMSQTVTGVGVQNCAVSKRRCSAVDHSSRTPYRR